MKSNSNHLQDRDGFSVARESLDDALLNADAAIKLLRLGVDGRIDIAVSDRGDPDMFTELRYSKRQLPGNRLKHLHLVKDGDEVMFPILSQSIFVRQVVARLIPCLVREMVEGRKLRGKRIQEDADALNEYITEGMERTVSFVRKTIDFKGSRHEE